MLIMQSRSYTEWFKNWLRELVWTAQGRLLPRLGMCGWSQPAKATLGGSGVASPGFNGGCHGIAYSSLTGVRQSEPRFGLAFEVVLCG